MIKDLNKLESAFSNTLGKISEAEAYALLEEQNVHEEALRIGMDILDKEFHPENAVFAQHYIRTDGIAARLRVAALRITPKPFKGGGALSDILLNEEFLASRNVDPEAGDDTQFKTEKVYCSAHMRIHATGWCTVANALKLPDDETLPEQYRVS